MSKHDDLSRSYTALEQDSTLIAVIEMSWSSWLVSALVPGLAREPEKKLVPDPSALQGLLQRWGEQAASAGRPVRRVVVAYEAGRDGFWLARWLRSRGIEAYVIHPASIPVARTHRRAKSDRLDLGLLKRALLGWLRGERDHCRMAAIPSQAEEDGKRPSRARERLVKDATREVNRMKGLLAQYGVRGFDPKRRRALEHLEGLCTPEGTPLPPNSLAELRRALERLAQLRAQIAEIEAARREHLGRAAAAPQGRGNDSPEAKTASLAQIYAIGLESADCLARELFVRPLRDRRAVARYASLTGAPDESGRRSREQGLARAGNARVRRVMIQMAWRFTRLQPDCELVQWFHRVTNVPGKQKHRRKVMIVALARKLVIALWRYLETGEIPRGLRFQPAP